MAQLFGPSSNIYSKLTLLLAALAAGAGVTLVMAFERSPYKTNENVIYTQPIKFSHDHHTAGLGIEGLNGGVSSYAIWCLHQVYYPGNQLMGFGLWRWKEDDWAVNPVYHAWSLFTRHTKRGDCVRLEIDPAADKEMLAFLTEALQVDPDFVYVAAPIDLAACMQLTDLKGFDSLKYESWPPQQSPARRTRRGPPRGRSPARSRSTPGLRCTRRRRRRRPQQPPHRRLP